MSATNAEFLPFKTPVIMMMATSDNDNKDDDFARLAQQAAMTET